MKGDKNIINIPKTIKYIKEQEKSRYYPYYGLEIYVGRQGSGKTLTATWKIKQLLEMYPEVTFITNVKIKGIENAKYFKNADELLDRLMEIDLNNIKGYLIFIDEIHVVFADLFGKTDPIFIQFLSQQRKISIHIIGTAQMFSRLNKNIREYTKQSGQVIICHKYFKLLQVNTLVNMESIKEDSDHNLIYKEGKKEWFIHRKEMYENYDTFAVISQIQGLMKGEKKNAIGLYDNI